MLGLEVYGYFEEVKWAERNAGNATPTINDPDGNSVWIHSRKDGTFADRPTARQ